ncbi:AAA family ATPase [Scytonema sp. UIC 10036]|uniref:ATP-binding protein n=1 Tax=Scytonema sp. UIC 10036 TaxID=2304196 RepID=UPI0012DA1A2C|nr:ATP-binding protein [Scytonema sp. UIC 10036]MUG91688.1 AAA family ATPase [Scytonema sp. UIC 10036]
MTPSKKQQDKRILVFRGEKVEASYHEEISIYSGNPCIEALPLIKTEDEVIDSLEFYPPFNEKERNFPSHLRLHLTQVVLDIFVPMNFHLDLEQRFSRMIRIGYKARNPVNKMFWQDVKGKVETMRSAKKTSFGQRSLATGFTILGISGVGKSTAVQEILNLYPQVIYHNRYGGQNLTLTQLVWLILECPADGSIKGLCLNFFQALDDILSTNYYEKYAGNGRRTVNEMMPYMALAASNIHLGVLVIDEIQRLTKLNIGGYEKMLDFFGQLINTIGIPVVLVGTYKAWSILGSEFRQIRRGTGQGDFVWDRMQPEDEDWQLLVEALWAYQYVQHPCKLTKELSNALYYECQGITHFAIILFMLAQVRAITTGVEKITVGIIKSVAKDCLRTARKILNALKSGNLEDLKNCEDVLAIDLEKFICEEQDKLLDENVENQEIKEAPSQIPNFDIKQSITDEPNISNSSNIKNRKKSQSEFKTLTEKGGLLEILDKAQTRGISGYQAFKEAGYILAATEHLDEVDEVTEV